MCVEADPNFLQSILWSDDTCFKLNGRVNRPNCMYWLDTNPHVGIQKEPKVPGIKVTGGISITALIDPFF